MTPAEETTIPAEFIPSDQQKDQIAFPPVYIKPSRISRPNAGNIPNVQEIQENRERTPSTVQIENQKEDLITKGSILEQVYHESNICDAKAPLLLHYNTNNQGTQMIEKQAQSNAGQVPQQPKLDDQTTALQNRLTEAINKHGRPMEFNFSTSQELGGASCCTK